MSLSQIRLIADKAATAIMDAEIETNWLFSESQIAQIIEDIFEREMKS